MKMSKSEIHTIVHSLRLFQEELRPKYGNYHHLSTDAPIFDEVSPLNDGEINALIRKLWKD